MDRNDGIKATMEHILKVYKCYEVLIDALDDKKKILLPSIELDFQNATLIDLLLALYNGQEIPGYDKMFESISKNSLMYLNKDQPSDGRIIVLDSFIKEMLERAKEHDASKLRDPEVSEFSKYEIKRSNAKYGSEEYNENLKALNSALVHHYRCNRHHPQHFGNGMSGMNIMDLIELMCDWQAVAQDIDESIIIGQQRFGYGKPMTKILSNTTNKYFKK